MALHFSELGTFPGGKIHKIIRIPIKLQPQDFITLTVHHSLPSAICQSYHLHAPTSLWLQWLPPQVIWSHLGSDSLYSLVSPHLGVAVCPYDLNSLKKTKKFIIFSFSLVIHRNGNFQDLFIPEIKLKVSLPFQNLLLPLHSLFLFSYSFFFGKYIENGISQSPIYAYMLCYASHTFFSLVILLNIIYLSKLLVINYPLCFI